MGATVGAIAYHDQLKLTVAWEHSEILILKNSLKIQNKNLHISMTLIYYYSTAYLNI